MYKEKKETLLNFNFNLIIILTYIYIFKILKWNLIDFFSKYFLKAGFWTQRQK